MANVNPLIQVLSHLSVFIPLTPWEKCAVHLVERNNPSSVYIFCQSSSSCLSNRFYQTTNIPTQTIFETKTENLPRLKKTDLVFLVVDKDVTWNNDTIRKYQLGGKNDFKLVVVANMSQNTNDEMAQMEDIFQAMWKSGVVYSAVLLKNDTSAIIFTYIPFRSSESCEDTSPVSLGECTETMDRVFDPLHKVENLNKCPIRITLRDDRPFLTYPLVGLYKEMMLEMGYRMNYTVQPIVNEDTRQGAACGPEEFEGVRGEVATGRAHMAVVNLNKRECSQLEYVGFPYMQCMSWCTPILPGNADVLDFLVGQFQGNVWIAITVTVFILVPSVGLLCFFSQEPYSGSTGMSLALVLFAQVPEMRFRADSVRIIVAIWLCACVVFRSAYEGESKSRSTTPIGSYIIQDLQDLVELKLRYCSTIGNIRQMETSKEPLIQWFYKNTENCKGSLYQLIGQAAREQNMAVFTNDLRCIATASTLSRETTLYPHTGGCFKTFQVTPILTLPGLPLNERWAGLLQRFGEAGLIEKWLNIKADRQDDGVVQPYSLKHFLPCLFFLATGCGLGFTAFIIEKAVGKYHYLTMRSCC